MLSLWPSLLNWSFFGIAVLRLALGLTVGFHAWRHLKNSFHSQISFSFVLGLIEAAIAGLLLSGLFTQAAALLLLVLASGSLLLNYRHRDDDYSSSLYFLLAAGALALATLGPGALAIDLPL